MNLSKVRPGTCTRAFVVTGWRVFQTFCIICLALSSVALLSIGRRGVFSSHSLLICPSRFVSAQLLVFFCFTRCVVQNLDISEKYQGIRSVIEGFSLIVCVRRFRGRLLIYQETCWLIRRELACLSRPIFSRGFRYWHQVAVFIRYSLVAVLWVSRPLILCVTGSPKFLEGLIYDCKQFPDNYSPCLLFLLFRYG